MHLVNVVWMPRSRILVFDLVMSCDNYSGSDLHESYLEQFWGLLVVDDQVADLSF